MQRVESEDRKAEFVDYAGLLRAARGFRVIVLGGYSGRGYADPRALRTRIRELVRMEGEGVMYVLGATGEGIGAAYTWIPEAAEEFGLKRIRLAGIVSSSARGLGLPPQDFVLVVDRPPGDWSVLEGSRSLVVKFAADSGGRMIYFGGGAVAEAEMAEARARGVPLAFEAAPAERP